MQIDYLQQYLKDEICASGRLLEELKALKGEPKHNLRHLYGLPTTSKLVYAESGGLSNIDSFPADTTVIIPVFPWSTSDFEDAVGSLTDFRALVDAGRVFPIVQHPLHYETCDHLAFLFNRKTPSYIVRGQYAYSAVLGIKPPVEFTDAGVPVLSKIKNLMDHCDRTHRTWLQHAIGDDTCWEYRYRNHSRRDDTFQQRLHASLCYRYSSVALCIGKHNADELLTVFPAAEASAILLHLHIMFDHMMCHGLGSDFVVRPDTPDGKDFTFSKTTEVTKPHELDVGEGFRMVLPQEKSEYVRSLLQQEHPLQGIDFHLLSPESLPELQDKLTRRFADFRKKVSTVSRGKQLTSRIVQITTYFLSCVATLESSAGLAGGAVGVIAASRVPWLAGGVASALAKIHRNKLASYIIGSPHNEVG